MDTMNGTDTRDEMNMPDQRNTSVNPMASTTTLDVRVNPVERITGVVEQTRESERCGSTSTQLVQLSTPSNTPGVSMVRNTGDSEDHWSCRTDKRIREMWFHLNTASSTTYTL